MFHGLLGYLVLYLSAPASMAAALNDNVIRILGEADRLYSAGHYERAFQIYGFAADFGDPSSAYMVGYMYWHGLGVGVSKQESIVWYKKSAKLGGLRAIRTLGSLHFHGTGVKRDVDIAAYWWRMSAERGDLESQRWLGELYAYSDKENRNYEYAVYWLRKASAQPDWQAKNSLAFLYATCEDLQFRDKSLALKLGLELVEERSISEAWDTLAAAYAVNEMFNDAALAQQYAIGLLPENDGRQRDYQKKLESYLSSTVKGNN